MGFGPPAGLQLRDINSPARGRLIVPSYYSDARFYDNGILKSKVFMMYSDNSGKTWKATDPIKNGKKIFPIARGIIGNEAQAVELPGGDLLVSARPLFGSRLHARSSDGGITWSPFVRIKDLPMPFIGCEGSIFSYPTAKSQLTLILYIRDQTLTRRCGEKDTGII